MQFILESNTLSHYLVSNERVDLSHTHILETAQKLFRNFHTEEEKIKLAFEFVRDQIHHTADIGQSEVTHTATEVLAQKHGFCYAKSMLLAALLRLEGIPTGFCYQKLILGDALETGYCLHGLNAVYIKRYNKWLRLDARGNTNGINAQFNIHYEQLAFPIRPAYDEIDYPYIYTDVPHILQTALAYHKDANVMFQKYLPIDLNIRRLSSGEVDLNLPLITKLTWQAQNIDQNNLKQLINAITLEDVQLYAFYEGAQIVGLMLRSEADTLPVIVVDETIATLAVQKRLEELDTFLKSTVSFK